MVEGMRMCKETETDAQDIKLSPEHLAAIVELVDNGTITRTNAKIVFEEVFKSDVDPLLYVDEKGLRTINDDGALTKTIQEIISANPQSVVDFKSGKEKAMGFIVGQTMRAMKGKADPTSVNRIVRELLSK